jgi:hypothetical protein
MSHRAPRTGSRRLRRAAITATTLLAGLGTAALVQSQAHAAPGGSPAGARAAAAKAAQDAATPAPAHAAAPTGAADPCTTATVAALRATARAHAHPDSARDAREAAALNARRAFVCD